MVILFIRRQVVWQTVNKNNTFGKVLSRNTPTSHQWGEQTAADNLQGLRFMSRL